MEKTAKNQTRNFYTWFPVILALLCLMFTTGPAWSSSGDVDGNGTVNLADAITALQVLVGTEVPVATKAGDVADVNGDKKIGLEEAVYALYVTALDIEKAELENTAGFTTLALADEENDVDSIKDITLILSYIGLENAQEQEKRTATQDVISNLLNNPFPCGSITTTDEASDVVVFTFSDEAAADCDGITGTVEVSPSLSDDILTCDVDFSEIIMNDRLINGHTTMTFSAESDRITATHTFRNMTVAGHALEGSVSVDWNRAGRVLTVSGEDEKVYSMGDAGAIVKTLFSYTHGEGMTGTATIDTGNESHTCTFGDIRIDPEAGLPESGFLTFNGTYMNFSGVSSENPGLVATLDGLRIDLSLEAAGDINQSTLTHNARPFQGRAALRTVDGCTTLLNEFKQAAIEDMEKQLDENLEYALECRSYRPMPLLGSGDPSADGWGGDYLVMAALPTASVSDMVNSAPDYVYEEAAPEEPDSPSDEGASEYSETNTQVEGVDEADFIKNDGSFIYILADGKFRIIDAWPPEDASEITSFEIEGQPKKLFVHNGKAFIYSSLDRIDSGGDGYSYYGDVYYEERECTYGYNCEFTGDGRRSKITVLDISDATTTTSEPGLITDNTPKLIREFYFSGSYLNSRRIGDAIHSVLVFPEPRITGIKYWPEGVESYCWRDWYYYDYYYWDCYYWGDCYWEEEEPEYSDEELRAKFDDLKQKNRELILASDITDWLPSVRDIRYIDGEADEDEGLLGTCDDFYVSMQKDGKNFLSMISTGIDGIGDLNATTIFGKPGAVYASSSAFYICSKHNYSPRILWFFDENEGERIEEASTVHKFTLISDPPSSEYKGSGVVRGRVLNQFAMDEYEGYFRMATTIGHIPNPDAHNAISVFEDKGSELEVVGNIDGIAPGEDIRSARFDRDRGYIVTFKKTDPLFVFDLSDPYNPSISGELKIPGFSTYIHRMDDNHLLSIGYDSEESEYGDFAWFQGIMLQVFDVSDMTAPTLIHKEVIGTRGSTSDAATNHLAFNFFRPKELLAIPMVICEGSDGGSDYGNMMTFSGLMVYKVTSETGFEYLGGVSHEAPETEDYYRGACSNWWTDSNSKVKRSIFMDDYVFSVTEDEIKVNLVPELGTDIAVVQLAD